MRSFLPVFLWILISVNRPVFAQSIPAHAEGLYEELYSVELDGNRRQSGVFSIRIGSRDHSKMAVLLPGYPSVVRPVVSNGVMQSSKLTGNFLIRSRRHLADESIALLLVDCHSDSGDYCSSHYQASADRQRDIQKLIDLIKQKFTTIQEVWLVGTSMGTISSSYMPVYGGGAYAGAIHTASITEPYADNSYRELRDFNYLKSGVPQFFVHHKADPCGLTTYSGAKRISDRYSIPLVTVIGGSGFQGLPCMAMTEHGFKGMERETMGAIGRIIRTGSPGLLEVR